ncbi:MAG: hypothetical protein AAB875_06710 [Patescibacteria group bacterium]
MTPETQKELSTLKAEQAAQKAEIDFFAQGLPFAEVKTCSAKGLFGGKWKSVIKEHISPEEYAMLVEKEGNKEIDFPLAALDLGDAGKWFSKNDKITVACANDKPTYNGQFKVLDVDRPYVFILKGMSGTTNGTVINNSRHEGAKKGLKRSAERISKLEGVAAPTDINTDDITPVENRNKKDNKPATKKWLVLFGLLILIFVIYKLNK